MYRTWYDVDGNVLYIIQVIGTFHRDLRYLRSGGRNPEYLALSIVGSNLLIILLITIPMSCCDA